MEENLKKDLINMPEADFEEAIGFTETKWRQIKSDLRNREINSTALLNQQAPEFRVKYLNTNNNDYYSLDKYKGEVLGLVLGSFTCPVFRSHNKRINEIHAELNSLAKFLCIYVYEMHPLDGWMIQVNLKDDVIFDQPTTIQERAAIASRWVDKQGILMDVGLDDMENTIDSRYAGAPERLYVIDREGLVKFKSPEGPFDDSSVEDWYKSLKEEI